MKRLFEGPRRTFGLFVLAVIAFPAGLIAGNVVGLTGFTNGQLADATAVNANFGAVATAVNDNDARLDVLTAVPAWVDIPSGGAWSSVASCRKKGWLISIRGYFAHSSTYNAWGATGITLPAACRPDVNIPYPVAACWNGNTSYSCFMHIATDGSIQLYTTASSAVKHFSPAGTFDGG